MKNLNSTEMYDYKTNTWLEHWMNVPRWEHTATVLSSGNILVVGGENADGPLSSAELFNVENKEWVILDDLSYPRPDMLQYYFRIIGCSLRWRKYDCRNL
ncbi:MAG: hypothetical protein CM1200mP8_2910 [Chloroflexota bacterium]|nr:MAG: hypothetical protein CM1200mP8_2910 [Chloroflexota bacterium]